MDGYSTTNQRRSNHGQWSEAKLDNNMAVASGPAGPVLAGPVFDVSDFKTAHARTINNQAMAEQRSEVGGWVVPVFELKIN